MMVAGVYQKHEKFLDVPMASLHVSSVRQSVLFQLISPPFYIQPLAVFVSVLVIPQ